MEILEIISGFLTPTIAVIAVYIAIQQHITNKNKLRLDLYDKRLIVYEGLISFLSHIISEGTAKMSEIQKYTEIINKGYFLFDIKFTDYLFKIQNKGLDLNSNKDLTKSELTKVERTKLSKEWKDLMKWFIKQTEESKKKFEKYLRYKN